MEWNKSLDNPVLEILANYVRGVFYYHHLVITFAVLFPLAMMPRINSLIFSYLGNVSQTEPDLSSTACNWTGTCLPLHRSQDHKEILLPSHLRLKGDFFWWQQWAFLSIGYFEKHIWKRRSRVKVIRTNPAYKADRRSTTDHRIKSSCGPNVSKCFYLFEMSVSAFLTWAWSAESAARSPPLWAGGWGSSVAAAGCSWIRSGRVSSGRFDLDSL